MSDENSYARISTAELGAERYIPKAVSGTQRRSDIAALSVALERRARRQRAVRMSVWATAGALAVAASVAGVWFATSSKSVSFAGIEASFRRAPVAESSHSPIPPSTEFARVATALSIGFHIERGDQKLPAGTERLEAGDRVISDANSPIRRIELSRGGYLDLAADSNVHIVSLHLASLFEQSRGRVTYDVAPLAANETFLVRTPDAEVEVRGTTFEVARVPSSKDCANGETRVAVAEGTVWVRRGETSAVLHRGDQWSSCVALSTVASNSVSPPASVKSQTPPPASAPVSIDPPPTTSQQAPVGDTPAARSALREQNDFFFRAIQLRRSGQSAQAHAMFGEFLQRWPASPLAERARIERMQTASPSEKSSDAKDYLAHHPSGAARTEASAVLGGDKPR